MNGKLAVILVLIIACISVSAGYSSEPPSKTVTRLKAENARLRHQVAGMNSLVAALFAELHQLQSDITDCVSKLPYPTDKSSTL